MRILIILCTILFIPAQAMACSCTQDSFSQNASQKNISKALYIFEGGAVKIKEKTVANYFSEVTFRVDTLYKGYDNPENIKALVDVKSSCGTTIAQLRKQKLFMLYAFKGSNILAGQCGSYISDADKAAIKKAYEEAQKSSD